LGKLEGIERDLGFLRSQHEKEYLNVQEVAKALDMTPNAVMYRLINDRNITPDDWSRSGKRYLIRRSSISKFERSNKKGQKSENE
jgi:hypothetical protein